MRLFDARLLVKQESYLNDIAGCEYGRLSWPGSRRWHVPVQ